MLRTILRRMKKEIVFLYRFVTVYGFWRLALFRSSQEAPIENKLVTFEADLNIKKLDDLVTYLDSQKIKYGEGAFSIYLGPSEKRILFPDIAHNYPPKTGLKIIKKFGEPNKVKYANVDLMPKSSRVAIAQLPTPIEQVALVNYMADLNFFPYCYDMVRLKLSKKCVCTAYIVEHIEGGQATKDECEMFLRKLQRELEKKDIGLILPNWKNHLDFRCPDANANLIKDRYSSELRYVDFQNFFFVNKDGLLRKKLREACKGTHYGESMLIMGGRHLYQSVPGFSKLSKRKTDERFNTIVAMLQSQNISFEERVVIDIGCNLGMLLAKCLSIGARWGIGFDRPEVIKHSRSILSLIGCSRISLFPVELDENTNIDEYLPEWLQKSQLDQTVIFYLAVRRELGFIKALKNLSWSVMVYEGHQNETIEETKGYLEDFANNVKAKLVMCQMYQDGTTTPRSLALLRRE